MWRLAPLFLFLGMAQAQSTIKTQQFLRLHYLEVSLDRDLDRYAPLAEGHFDWSTAVLGRSEEDERGVFLSDVIMFQPYIGMEVGYVYLGDYSTYVEGPERSYKIVQKLHAVEAGLYLSWRWKLLSIFARGGLSTYEDKAELVDLHPNDAPAVTNPLSSWRERDHDRYYGGGLEIHIDDSWSASLQYEKLGLGEIDSSFWSGGLSYRF